MASSWPAPPPYQTRRSRSRSPGLRGGYGARASYGEQGFGDPYRGDWDSYDRDRAWASYERERAAYDYGRRPRSRSPGLDDGGRKRRRSMSPYDTRYDPRPRYEDYDHGRYGRSPPRGYGSRSGPPDPRTMEYAASLKQYADWFRFNYPQEATQEDVADKQAEAEAGDGSKPRNGIRSRWEAYKKEFGNQQVVRLFEQHRKNPWFLEKYGLEDEYVNLRKRTRKHGLRGRIATFLDDLELGEYDPDLAPEPAQEAEPPSPIKEEANGHDGLDDNKDDQDGQVEENAPGETPKPEANGTVVQRGSNSKRTQITGEEAIIPNDGNSIMIRTIPPDIGRLKLEEAASKIPGYNSLALGEVAPKRNFYRTGWFKFRDDADMPAVMSELSENKIEGFKLHVMHLQKPFSAKMRHTPEAASRPDRMEKDLANVKALATILETEYNQLRTTVIPPMGVAVKPPTEGAEGAEKPSEGESEMKVEDPDSTIKHDDELPVQPEEEEDPEPRENGSAAVDRRIEHLLSELRESSTVNEEDEKAWEEKKTSIALDLYLSYLRAAFNTCYYCAFVADYAEELQRRCIGHIRKPLSSAVRDEIKAEEEAKLAKAREDEERAAEPAGDDAAMEGEDKDAPKEGEKAQAAPKDKPIEGRDWKRNDERWFENLDQKIALLLDRDSVDPKAYGGKSYEEELAKLVEPYIKQEDEGKFRCKECQKLFKATAFVEKHVANKHPEHIKPLGDLPFFNNFALDPARVTPPTHPPQQHQQPPVAAHGMHAYPPDYRGGYYGNHAPFPPPYVAPNGYYDPYGGAYGAPYAYPARSGARDVGRLSDRIGSYAPGYESAPLDVPLPAGVGLPQKPVQATLEPGPGPRRNTGGRTGPPPPPPPDAKEDPRAAAGRKVSYHDMDDVAEGDVELNY